MANKERDVSLVIKAKEQSQKAIDAVTDALRALEQQQARFGAGANKAGGIVQRLQGAFSDLDNELKGLAALNKVAVNMDRAAAAVGRLDAEVKASVASQEKLAGSIKEAAENTARLQAAADEAKAAYEKQRAAVAALTKEEKKSKDTTEALRKSRDALKETYTQARAAASAAGRQEETLADQYSRGRNALEAQQEALTKSNDELAQIAGLAQKASSSLGGVEATQDAVAKASARAAADMAKLNAVLNATPVSRAQTELPGTKAGATAAYKEQIAAVNQTREAWKAAQEEANKLARSITSVETPTVELKNEFLLAQAASKLAKQEYYAQGQALNELRQKLVAARSASGGGSALAPSAGTQGGAAIPAVPAAVPASLRSTSSAADALSRAFKSVYGESRQAMNLFQRMRGEVLSLTSSFVGLYAAIAGIGSVITTAISYQSTYNKLLVVTGGDTAKATVEMQYLKGEAERLGIAFTVLSGSYASFADAAQGANFSVEDTRKVFKSISEAGVVMNVTTEDMAGIFKALGQIMSKGKVQAEELRGQLGDRMTGAFRLMANAIGVTAGELDDMLKKGEVLADRSTLIKFADTVSERYGTQLPNALQGVNAEIGRFGNNLVEAQNKIAESGFLDAFTQSLGALNTYFQSTEGQRFFEGIGVALGKLVSVLPGLVENMDKFVLVFQVFAGLKLSQVIVGIIPSLLSLGTQASSSLGVLRAAYIAARAEITATTIALELNASVASGAAVAGYTAAARGLSIFGGAMAGAVAGVRTLTAAIAANPIGLLITGVSLLASFALPAMLTATDRSTEALARHDELVNKVRESYNEASDAVTNWADKVNSITQTELAADTLDLTDAIMKARQAMSDMSEVDSPEMFTAGVTELVRQFQFGEIPLDKFLKQLDEIGQANPDLDKHVIAKLIKLARESGEGTKKLEENAAMQRVLGNAATEADRKLLGLTNQVAGLNAQLGNTDGLDAYAQKLNSLNDFIPDLKSADALADELKKIRDAAQAEFAAGRPLKEVLGRKTQAEGAARAKYAPKKTSGERKAETAAEKQAKDQRALNEELAHTADMRELDAKYAGKATLESEIAEAIERAKYDALKKNLTISTEQEQRIRDSVTSQFKATEAAKVRSEIDKANLDLIKERGDLMSREQYIMQQLNVTSLDGLTTEQDELAKVEGKIYDVMKAERDRKKAQEAADRAVESLQNQQRSLQEQITFANENGDLGVAGQLKEQLAITNAELIKATDAALAFYRSLDAATNPNAAGAIVSLESLRRQTMAYRDDTVVTAKQINDQFASASTNGLDQFIQKVSDGRAVLKSLGESLRQTTADILMYIAKLIEQAAIMKALEKTPIGKYVSGSLNSLNGQGMKEASNKLKEAGVVVAGAAAAILVSAAALKAAGQSSGGGGGGSATSVIASIITKAIVAHTGDVVGSSGSASRSVYATAFSNAARYHTGGVAGLKPNEVPAILEQGEGIFTKDQMKALGTGGASPKVDLKVVNAIDGGDFLSQALQSDTGQKVFKNFIRANRSAINGLLAR